MNAKLKFTDTNKSYQPTYIHAPRNAKASTLHKVSEKGQHTGGGTTSAIHEQPSTHTWTAPPQHPRDTKKKKREVAFGALTRRQSEVHASFWSTAPSLRGGIHKKTMISSTAYRRAPKSRIIHWQQRLAVRRPLPWNKVVNPSKNYEKQGGTRRKT